MQVALLENFKARNILVSNVKSIYLFGPITSEIPELWWSLVVETCVAVIVEGLEECLYQRKNV